jgi:hypothetical protein
MGGIKDFTVCVLAAGLLMACSCDSDEILIPDSILAHAHIQSAVIPQSVVYGSSMKISIRVVEGCRLGDWEGVAISFESRSIYVDTRARISFDYPPDCETREESYTVGVSYSGDKGTQPLPQGNWDVFVVGRNTTVTGRVTVS